MSDSGLLRKTFRHFRSERMRRFEETFDITANTRILDVGGSPLIWQFASVHPKLTIANIPSALEAGFGPIDQLGADGRFLPFRDGSFDIVFSNSVIEHVASEAAQRQFANEVARVGRSYWVQTPNRKFPVEMHTMLPLIHFLPKSLQRSVVERFTVWEFLTRPSQAQKRYYLHHYLTELRLLGASELQRLFPDSKIIHENLLGMVKSLVAVRVR